MLLHLQTTIQVESRWKRVVFLNRCSQSDAPVMILSSLNPPLPAPPPAHCVLLQVWLILFTQPDDGTFLATLQDTTIV